MMDIREPKYAWGQRVKATVDLFNDGSHPEHPEEALLVQTGGMGEVVQVGHQVDENIPVYMVEFELAEGKYCVVGCFEEEIVPA